MKAVPQENVDTPSDYVLARSGKLTAEHRVELVDTTKALVYSDSKNTYSVTRKRDRSGYWNYVCDCKHAEFGYCANRYGCRMPCCHIKAAETAWNEQLGTKVLDRVLRDSQEHEAVIQPVQGQWLQNSGWTVIVSGYCVFESGRGQESPFDWSSVAPVDVERTLRERGFRPVAELVEDLSEGLAEFERELAELEGRNNVSPGQANSDGAARVYTA